MSTHLNRRALLLAGAGTFTTAALLTFEPAVAGTATTKVFKGKFTHPDGPDWVYLPFDVPAGVNRIDVSYTYHPTHTPVGISFNVVDIGIFDPSGSGIGNIAGFRGWSGGARNSFTLSRSDATPGYLAGPITPGRWKIALGPYQIQKPGTPYKVTVTLTYGEPGDAFVSNPAPVAIDGRGPGWYRGDLHVHTVHSDGSQTQADVLQYAVAAGLDFIGTSEHNTSSAQRTWGDYLTGEYADFLVITGEEVTTRAGHWLATGLDASPRKGTWIDWRYLPKDRLLAHFTQKVRDLGGLSIAAHPYQLGGGITWEFGYDFSQMDAVEVWNGPWSGLNAVANGKAVARWHQLLVKGVYKPAVGNSDTHKQSQTIGLAQTVVRADSLSADAIIAGYRGGHSWITGSSAVDLTFTASLGDVTGECGDRVPSKKSDRVTVHLEVTGVDGAVATLIGPQGVLATAPAVDGTITLDKGVAGGLAFIRVEVKQGSTMVALTNPIFLR